MPTYSRSTFQGERPLDTTIVTLTIARGKDLGRQYTFGTRTLCTVGRALDCHLQLSSDPLNREISRHHCLLEIDPPSIRVRDLGSLNGTFVNGERFGGRPVGQSPGETTTDSASQELKEGDELRIGSTILRVGIAQGHLATPHRALVETKLSGENQLSGHPSLAAAL